MNAVEVALRLVVVEIMKRGVAPPATPARESKAPGLVVPSPKSPAPLMVSLVFEKSVDEAILNLFASLTSIPMVHWLVVEVPAENSRVGEVVVENILRRLLGVLVPIPTLEFPATTNAGELVPVSPIQKG